MGDTELALQQIIGQLAEIQTQQAGAQSESRREFADLNRRVDELWDLLKEQVNKTAVNERAIADNKKKAVGWPTRLQAAYTAYFVD